MKAEYSGIIDGEARERTPPGKMNVKTGPPLVDILIFFAFFGVFSFFFI